jgi:hypothetical protein
MTFFAVDPGNDLPGTVSELAGQARQCCRSFGTQPQI